VTEGRLTSSLVINYGELSVKGGKGCVTAYWIFIISPINPIQGVGVRSESAQSPFGVLFTLKVSLHSGDG